MPHEPEGPTDAASIPRAFCHATGFLYQGVGFLMSLCTCCWWSFTGLTQQELRPSEPNRQVVEVAKDATPQLRWAMVAVCLLFAGGLWLTALGMGLQNDRFRTGRAAKWTTGPVALFFLVYLGMSVFSWKASAIRIAATAVLSRPGF
jgi:hypothetical protein